MKKDWNLFEKVWLLSFILLGVMVAVMQDNNGFSFVVLLSGIMCVVLAAKGNIYNYYFGLFNSSCYAYLCYKNGLYGEMGLNLLFYLPTGLIGILMWKKHTQRQQLTSVKSLSMSTLGLILVLNLIGIGALGYGLSLIDSQNTPYIDASTNVLAITATLLMMLRFKEQWWFYITLNLLTILMWLLRLQQGSNEGMMMVLMWFAFLINSFYGFYNWRKIHQQSIHST